MSSPRLIYIAGMSHSGSTLLDLACSSSGLALSLGEVAKSIALTREVADGYPCSCGATGALCPFWGPLLPGLAGLSLDDAYSRVLDAAAQFAPDAAFLIDSGKSTAGLDLARAHAPRVLHVVKDVRAFVVSHIDNAAKKGRVGIRIAHTMRGWLRRNKVIAQAVAGVDPKALVVSYDVLCGEPEAQAARINAALGADLVDPWNILGSERHHILVGNRMSKSGPGKRLHYDRRWVSRSDWVWAYALHPSVQRYNHAVLTAG